MNARSGAVEGPRDLGSACVAGPIPTADGAALRLRDGRVLFFEEGLEHLPRADNAFADALDAARLGHDAGLAVLRRRAASGHHLRSPWSDWTVRVEEEVFRATPPDDLGGGFAVRRAGRTRQTALTCEGKAHRDADRIHAPLYAGPVHGT